MATANGAGASDASSWVDAPGVSALLLAQNYLADAPLSMAVFLSARLGKPLLVEGEPGCGKTEIAKALAAATGVELLRLQCFEGLDARSALYDWDYPRQLLTIRLHERDGADARLEKEVFSERFLLKRPLVRALEGDGAHRPVLLIDEIDRADEEFEGLLLEFLSEFQVTIPELGTIRAKRIPLVVITSNRTRELSDALKRRCLYVYLDYPDVEKEVAIVRRRLPDLAPALARSLVGFVQRLRSEPELAKRPGVAETLDWAAALLSLGRRQLDPETIEATLGFLVKDAQDLRSIGPDRIAALLG
ncbi:MAG TPA: MoxR family ATPase [Thermoplasmata archaeon]|nr:MoxR family ATPase [Thermoplasmata archaeon]